MGKNRKSESKKFDLVFIFWGAFQVGHGFQILWIIIKKYIYFPGGPPNDGQNGMDWTVKRRATPDTGNANQPVPPSTGTVV